METEIYYLDPLSSWALVLLMVTLVATVVWMFADASHRRWQVLQEHEVQVAEQEARRAALRAEHERLLLQYGAIRAARLEQQPLQAGRPGAEERN